MEKKKYRINLTLTCETEDGPWLSNEWFKRDLMREIECCIELYELKSIKIEEVKNDAAGK